MEEVLFDRPADGVARITLNRPEVRNALSMSVRERIGTLFNELGNDTATRCIVLTGGPQVFAAGADIRDMVDRGAAEMLLAGEILDGSVIQVTTGPEGLIIGDRVVQSRRDRPAQAVVH